MYLSTISTWSCHIWFLFKIKSNFSRAWDPVSKQKYKPNDEVSHDVCWPCSKSKRTGDAEPWFNCNGTNLLHGRGGDNVKYRGVLSFSKTKIYSSLYHTPHVHNNLIFEIRRFLGIFCRVAKLLKSSTISTVKTSAQTSRRIWGNRNGKALGRK